MDSFIRAFPATADSDLMICAQHGVVYQRDMQTARVSYDTGYFAKVSGYEGTKIAQAVNAGRVALLSRHLPAGSSVLDIGAGTGAFVRAAAAAGFVAYGFDVLPEAVSSLRQQGRYAEDGSQFSAVTLWDTLEHLENPATCLDPIRQGAWLFLSLPIFKDLGCIRSSKHYRPGEHLYYWTDSGLVRWLARRGFLLLECSTHEIDAGRDSIGAFAFRRSLLDHGTTLRACSCGGEMQIDYFDHPNKAVEWFARCRECAATGPSALTHDAAQELWQAGAR